MKLFPKTNNLSPTLKITMAGLLIALDILGQKVFAINYLSFAPFLRISFAGPCIVIFASIFLGPWYGALIGLSGDLLGYLIFDPKAYPLFFQITLIYTVLGFVPYYIFKFIKLIKNKVMLTLLMSGFLTALLGIVTVFLAVNDEITLFSSTYEINIYHKIIIPCVLLALFVALILFIVTYDKKSKKNDYISPIQTGFACMIIELFVMVIFGSLMKAWAFGFKTYLVILLTQSMILFINVPLNTVLLTILIQTIFPKYVINNRVE